MIDEILPQTTTADELEATVKERLAKLPQNRQLAEMQTIQSNYLFIVKDEPDWTDSECKMHVYLAWIRKSER